MRRSRVVDRLTLRAKVRLGSASRALGFGLEHKLGPLKTPRKWLTEIKGRCQPRDDGQSEVREVECSILNEDKVAEQLYH